MKKREKLVLVLSLAVLGLWLYVVFYKLADHRDFVSGMHRQPLPHWMQGLAIWFLPPAEAALALLFFTKRWRIYGFLFSCALLLVFALYIAFGLLGFYGKLPCGCGGLIQNLSLKQHLVFNYLYAAIAALGFLLCYENDYTSKTTIRHLFSVQQPPEVDEPFKTLYYFNLFALSRLFKHKYPHKFVLFPRRRCTLFTGHGC
ncbi:hypothetical protein GCM10023231_01260 [Olivibacter ginsenosidimutans]|uniref:Methylamine utilisation protein MauE domain-containing protein n=1 Tax=Olivibacter ginsenosidimutans TaxID=1176537 RepID=A0ABP9ABL3_9SPHI